MITLRLVSFTGCFFALFNLNCFLGYSKLYFQRGIFSTVFMFVQIYFHLFY